MRIACWRQHYTLSGVGGGRGRVIETVIMNLSRVRNEKKLQFKAFKTYNQILICTV